MQSRTRIFSFITSCVKVKASQNVLLTKQSKQYKINAINLSGQKQQIFSKVMKILSKKACTFRLFYRTKVTKFVKVTKILSAKGTPDKGIEPKLVCARQNN